MKNSFLYFGIFILLATLLYSCGPSEEEQQQREQARQDSLEQVRQDSLEQVRRQRQDSLAQARQDSLKKARENKPAVSFTENGRFSLQVSSWRSEVKAQQRVNMWNERGYEGHAYVVQHGTQQTGDVWFRVRIGRIDTREEAEQLRQNLHDEYQTESWIATN